MKLSRFIRDNQEAIIREWESFARGLLPAAGGMDGPRLRNHSKEILQAIAEDLEAPQDDVEQAAKSKGRGRKHRMQEAGMAHAALRIADGFNLGQLVAEYRALRASVLRLFEKTIPRDEACDLQQINRFNEALDEALIEATNRFMVVMTRTSDQFLAVLGHDLRNPLGAVMMSAAIISRRGQPKSDKAAEIILTSAARMKRMVNDLLDLTRTRLGSGIPIEPEPMDLASLCKEILAELEAFQPEGHTKFRAEGNLHGSWDPDRLAQVLSNLVGNALQHGERDSVVGLAATSEGDEILIEVHNQGPAIPEALLANVFEPMVRQSSSGEGKRSTSLGLGLHIAREIVLAHGGTIHVKSTARAGTTFSVRLPRHCVAVRAAHTAARPPDQHDSDGEIVVAHGEPEPANPGA